MIVFTGIVESEGVVTAIEPSSAFRRIRIRTGMDLSDVRQGDSVSVDGACLTATEILADAGEFAADVSPETLKVTTLGMKKAGDTINLEKALRLDSRLGGHIVAGHVDCIGRISEKRTTGDGFLLGFAVDSGRYLVEKGSVAVDGVSLTVNRVTGAVFTVMIIPHTAGLTGLTAKNINDKVNIEFDIIGKYIEKLMQGHDSGQGINSEKLRKLGFM